MMLQAHVTALHLDGRHTDHGPLDILENAGTWDGQDRGSIYVFAEAQGVGREQVEGALVEIVIHEFRRSHRGVTAGLLRAVRCANQELYQENSTSITGAETLAALATVVLRGVDMYGAIAGPILVAILQGGQLQRRPISGEEAPPLLGREQNVEPELFHSRLQPGDAVLLASPVVSSLSDELLQACLMDGLDKLVSLFPQGTLSAVLLRCVSQGRGPSGSPKGVRSSSVLQEDKDTSALPSWLIGSAPAPLDRERHVEEAEPVPIVGEGAGVTEPPLDQKTLTFPPIPRRPWFGRSVSPLPRRPTVRGGKAARGVGTSWLAALLLNRRLALLAMGLAVLAFVAGGLLAQAQSDRTRRVEQLIQEAEEYRRHVSGDDRAASRSAVAQALARVEAALALDPKAEKALSLRQALLTDLDTINATVRLSNSNLVTFWDLLDTQGRGDRLVMDGRTAYILDRTAQVIYRLAIQADGFTVRPYGDTTTSPSPGIILRRGDQVGASVMGDLLDITFIPAGGQRRTAALVAVESGGTLAEYDPVRNTWRSLPLRGSREWKRPQATAGYNGNFYLLDTGRNQIYRHVATANGYEDAPSAYVLAPNVDLTNAVDMAIDGDVFVLTIGGRVLWLSRGQLQPYPLDGLDPPLAAPLSIYATEKTQYVWIADPQNRRIIQASKTGQFLRQFILPDALEPVRSLVVDEGTNHVYILAGPRFYRLSLR